MIKNNNQLLPWLLFIILFHSKYNLNIHCWFLRILFILFHIEAYAKISLDPTYLVIIICARLRVLVFNATFNNILVIWKRSCLLVEETWVPLVTDKLYSMFYRVHLTWVGFELTTLESVYQNDKWCHLFLYITDSWKNIFYIVAHGYVKLELSWYKS